MSLRSSPNASTTPVAPNASPTLISAPGAVGSSFMSVRAINVVVALVPCCQVRVATPGARARSTFVGGST